MRENFTKSLGMVLVHEGGYVNHPKDPGGATNKGVTQAVYDSWRASHGQPKQSVKFITGDEVEGIYRLLYWDRVRGDDLPSGVDYAVFDFAVNSGVNRASRYLQTALGVAADGQVGRMTLTAAAAANPATLALTICDKRLSFLRGLGTFKTFGKGWTNRVTGVRAAALEMANEQ
jgi:lysozyme family protein